MPRWSDKTIIQVYQRSGGRCFDCKRHHDLNGYTYTWNVDHLMPKSLGGKDHVTNLAVACITCNTSKGNNYTRQDLIAGVANEVIDRLGNNSPTENLKRKKNSVRRNPNQMRRQGSGQRPTRKGQCSSCERYTNLVGSFCRNCERKSRQRGLKKREGECQYGRCTEPVRSRGFLGIGATQYCHQHQNQHERGLL